ncbi:hypothetical protein M0P65_03360 [Candidatus Gracilibacteria bacterium]|nr:hypothetical protein [Candidatus Gracilibacteria bacterium]
MKAKKNLKSFLREEDGKTIKKSLLIAGLGLIVGYGINSASAAHSNYNNHYSGTGTNYHSSTHSNHNNHSSY